MSRSKLVSEQYHGRVTFQSFSQNIPVEATICFSQTLAFHKIALLTSTENESKKKNPSLHAFLYIFIEMYFLLPPQWVSEQFVTKAINYVCVFFIYSTQVYDQGP